MPIVAPSDAQPAWEFDADGQPSPDATVIRLFQEFRDFLFRYVLSFRLPAHECEDILQEAFLALLRHLRSNSSGQNLRGWLVRVVHNLALKKRIAAKKFPDSVDPDVLSRHLDPSANAEAHVIFGQTQQRLLSLFHGLPEQQQQCLQLRMEGLTYREIARVLGISLGSVAKMLAQSISRLSKAE